MSRIVENAVQRAMQSIEGAVEEAPAFEAAHSLHLQIGEYAPRPSIGQSAYPTARLLKAIDSFAVTRKALAVAEVNHHLSQMELIHAEDEDRKNHSIKEINR